MDGGAWWAVVHGVTKSQTRLSDFTFISLSCIGEGHATHSSVLAWRIPGTGEPGGLPSMGSHRVGHDWSDLAAATLCLEHFFFWQLTGISKAFLLVETDCLCQLLSCVQQFAIPWGVACQASLSMGLCRQDYWTGLPFPSQGKLTD